MSPRPGEAKGTEALAALTDLARNGVGPATPVQLGRGWQAVSVRLAVRKERRSGLLRWSLVGALAAASVLGVLKTVSFSRARLQPPALPALAYEIEGGNVVDGGYLAESGKGSIRLVFSEGTEFVLRSGTRGRLRSIDSSGARIAIEQGTASFQVTPRNEARWLVDVGPFLVTVKGTVFTVAWDASSERLELNLTHGRVSVTGPVSGGEIALRAGQRLVVNVPNAETLITEQKPEEAWLGAATGPTTVASPREGPAAAPVPDRPAARMGAGAAPAPAKADGGRGWPAALVAGNWDRILADAERAGVKTTLEKASSEDLFALADAARYRRRIDLARQALLAERRRFPNSVRALDAAFLLGRLEESNERGMAKALHWYDEYLARAPSGTYASEALGRKMIVTSKREGTSRAEPIAEKYLRLFPNGTYAGAAQALRRAP
jgi:hypothetical protein